MRAEGGPRGSRPQGRSDDRRLFREPYTGNDSIPSRGQALKGGGVFAGLLPDKVIEEFLNDAAIYKKTNRPPHMDGHNIAAVIRTLAPQAYILRENLSPDLVESGNVKSLAKFKVEKEGRFEKSDLPGDANYGRRHAKDDIDWNVAAKDFIPIEMLARRPWPSPESVKARTTRDEAKNIARDVVKRLVKEGSLK